MNPANVEIELQRMNLTSLELELPEAVRQRIDRTLASLPAPSQRRWIRRLSLGGAAAATVCAVAIGSAFVVPDAAAALRQFPVISSVFKVAGDYGLKLADERGLSDSVNQAVTDQGITLQVTDVLYDSSLLSVGYVQKTNGSIGELTGGVEFTIDGKRYEGRSGGTGSYIDDHTYAGVIQLQPSEELPSRFELQMNVSRIGEKEGSWRFQMPVRKAAGSTKAVIPMQSKTAGGVILTVKKLVFAPSSTLLDVDYKVPASMNDRMLLFRLIDDQGYELQSHGGGGGGKLDKEWYTSSYSQNFGPAVSGRLPKSVTVKAYFDGPQAGEAALKEQRATMEQAASAEQPLVLPQGPAGRLLITQVERLPDKILVHYRTEGAIPQEQAYSLWLWDANGNKVLQLQKPSVTVDPMAYSFIREFPPVAGDKLTFGTKEMMPPSDISELEMVVQVSN